MMDLTGASWINRPEKCHVGVDRVSITTESETDFWQRSYYGFRNRNAPALLLETEENFTFSAKAAFRYEGRFDQCGLVIFLDEENWFKASIEYENSNFSRLGSVVTNGGYSDWATVDVPLPSEIWYRLSRRGPDFLIESSLDGAVFRQMRIFHLHALGETTPAMGEAFPPLPAERSLRFGVYACSPLQSSFTAAFSEMALGPCEWRAHGGG